MWEKVGGRKWVLLPPITNMRGRLTYILNLCVHSLIGYIWQKSSEKVSYPRFIFELLRQLCFMVFGL